MPKKQYLKPKKQKQRFEKMFDVDKFCNNLMEEAKRFYEKAKAEANNEGKNAYLHSALLLAFASLEANINAIADDFSLREKDLTILEQSILFEKRFEIDNGKFKLTNDLKMYRIEDRIQFLYHRFAGEPINRDSDWWNAFKEGINLRNKLTHPKEVIQISESMIKKYLVAVINALDEIYKAVYKRSYPLAQRDLNSNMDF